MNNVIGRRGLRAALLSSALLACAAPLWAESVFDAPAEFTGMVQFMPSGASAIYAGDEIEVRGDRFAPGQEIRLLRGTAALGEGIVADAEGKFAFRMTLPGDAALGLHPVVVQTEAPDSATVITLKVSPEIPLSGAERFDIAAVAAGPGLYQVAVSDKNGWLFVTSANGRPPVKESKLQKLDARTLGLLAEVTPADAPARGDREGGVHAVYGVGVDDANGTVWVTNTRQETVAVYRQDDLSLVKQFEPGVVPHARDVVVDAAAGRAYASTSTTGQIAVFDTATLEVLEPIRIASKQRGGEFGAMSLALDAEGGKLYTVSLNTPEVARVDLATGAADVFALPTAQRGAGIAADPATGRMFVVAQGTDNLVALDAGGKVLYDVPVGAGPLNVAWHKGANLLVVTNRASGTLAVVNADDGQIVANLDGGSFPNHVAVAADGTIYAVNKRRGAEDATGDHVRSLRLKD